MSHPGILRYNVFPDSLTISTRHLPTLVPLIRPVHTTNAHERPGLVAVEVGGSVTPRTVCVNCSSSPVDGRRPAFFLAIVSSITRFSLLGQSEPFFDATYHVLDNAYTSSVTTFVYAHFCLPAYIASDHSFPNNSVTRASQVQTYLEFLDELYGPKMDALLWDIALAHESFKKCRTPALLPDPRVGTFMLFCSMSDIAT